MEQAFDLQKYLSDGVEDLVKKAVKATLSNPLQSIFIAKYAIASRAAAAKRAAAEEKGEHIPPFLIASITSQCNLHCAGCYARSENACVDTAPVCQLTGAQWQRIFEESRDLGISFILLAGGEPLIRKDVLTAAGNIPEILFPVFTNGTMLDQTYIRMFARNRNLMPVLSIEGREEKTDERRGEGVYQKLIASMDLMRQSKIMFGASVTVTTVNLQEVTSDKFLAVLYEKGCQVVFYVEFVPVTPDSEELAPGDTERQYMKKRLLEIRKTHEGMIFIAFPGDEEITGGCVAAGRGFFHINSHGGAEPCPFSPYSDINVRETSVREALNSRLFQNLQSGEVLMEEHAGGCVLFERKEQVEALLKK